MQFCNLTQIKETCVTVTVLNISPGLITEVNYVCQNSTSCSSKVRTVLLASDLTKQVDLKRQGVKYLNMVSLHWLHELRLSHTLHLDERVEKTTFELSLHVSQTAIRLSALNKHCQPHCFSYMCCFFSSEISSEDLVYTDWLYMYKCVFVCAPRGGLLWRLLWFKVPTIFCCHF